MKRSPDNQINASFIDISRIKWLVFLLRSSFFRTTRPLAISEATAYYRPAPGRTDSIPERHQRQWIRQRNRSWIKGLGKNPQKSELIYWRQCRLSGATEPCPLGLRETLACIHVILHNVPSRVACWHGSRPNSQTNGMRVKTSADPRLKKEIAGTASDGNWLKGFWLAPTEQRYWLLGDLQQ